MIKMKGLSGLRLEETRSGPSKTVSSASRRWAEEEGDRPWHMPAHLPPRGSLMLNLCPNSWRLVIVKKVADSAFPRPDAQISISNRGRQALQHRIAFVKNRGCFDRE
jgi:hypothetical protein